jgi:hypothetical protein
MTTGNWWLDVGLGGIVGAVLGGVVTGATVASTMVFQRRQTELGEARKSAAEVQRLGMRLAFAVAGPEPNADGSDVRRSLIEMRVAIVELVAMTARRWPAFSSRLREISEGMVNVSSAPGGSKEATRTFASNMFGDVAAVAGGWIMDPSWVPELPPWAAKKSAPPPSDPVR